MLSTDYHLSDSVSGKTRPASNTARMHRVLISCKSLVMAVTTAHLPLIFSVIFPSYCLSNVFVPLIPSLFLFSPFSLLQSPFTRPFPFSFTYVLHSFLLSFSPFDFSLPFLFLSAALSFSSPYLFVLSKETRAKGKSTFSPWKCMVMVGKNLDRELLRHKCLAKCYEGILKPSINIWIVLIQG